MHLGPDIWVGIAAAGVAAVGVWYARLQARVARQAEEAAQAKHNKLLIRGVDTVINCSLRCTNLGRQHGTWWRTAIPAIPLRSCPTHL
jgi:hypothetical protein